MSINTKANEEITLETLKEFVKENAENLYLIFMEDGAPVPEPLPDVELYPLKVHPSEINLESRHNLGIYGIKFHWNGEDYFTWYDGESDGPKYKDFHGIKVSNGLGDFALVTKVEA